MTTARLPFRSPASMRHLARYQRALPIRTSPGTAHLSRSSTFGLRYASGVAEAVQTTAAVAQGKSIGTRISNFFIGTSILLGLGFGYLYITDTRSSVHRWVVIPLMRTYYTDAEEAHSAGTRILKALYDFGLYPRERGPQDAAGDLSVEVFGHVLDNPLATSGGLDKGAEIPSPMFEIGPAIVEVGGITPLPQEGNEKPRVWRIPSQNAIINRYGLNSEGAEHVAMRLRQRVRLFARAQGLGIDAEAEQKVLDGEAGVPPGSLKSGRLLAVQVAKNKTTSDTDFDAVRRDYVFCVDQLAKYADIIVVNVSSPNTPGLRSLQKAEPLQHILTGVVASAKAVKRRSKPAVMVKVSPDEDSEEEIRGICDAVWKSGVDGVIVGNTTKKRPDPLPAGYVLADKESAILLEQGGYSGPQLFDRTVALTKKYRRALDEGLRGGSNNGAAAKVIFSSGGVTTGAQALQVLNAGASVAMVYTALVYGGVGTISRIKDEMRDAMQQKPVTPTAAAAATSTPAVPTAAVTTTAPAVPAVTVVPRTATTA